MEIGLVTVTLLVAIRPSVIRTKIQYDSLAVQLFLEFIFTRISLDGLNFAGAGIGLSPKFSNFDSSFHTSLNILTDF
jgi:hypothetical protein